jgi:hypothetical protein
VLRERGRQAEAGTNLIHKEQECECNARSAQGGTQAGGGRHTRERIVGLPPYPEPESIDKLADLLEMAEMGSSLENSMVGGIRGDSVGCSETRAALEMQSVVPQAELLVATAGCVRSGQYV